MTMKVLSYSTSTSLSSLRRITTRGLFRRPHQLYCAAALLAFGSTSPSSLVLPIAHSFLFSSSSSTSPFVLHRSLSSASRTTTTRSTSSYSNSRSQLQLLSSRVQHNYCKGSSLLSPYWINLRGGESSASQKNSNSRRYLSTTTAADTDTVTPTKEEEDIQETSNNNSRMTSAEKLAKLRARMKELDLDVYLVPSDDPHLSEYVPSAYMRRAYLSDFKGSAGTAVVTTDEAFMWTDSRYWNEAGLQLDSNEWTLQKAGLPTTLTIPKWLGERAVEHYKKESKPLKVGIDPFVHAATFAKEVQEAFEESAMKEFDNDDADDGESIVVGELVTSQPNLVDEIWGDYRPAIPTSPFRVHPMEYAGVSVSDKIDKIRKEMKEKKATMSVFTTLDDVAYLLNVRAKGDVETCPVGIGYVVVTNDDLKLYCDPKKVESSDVQKHLSEVTIMPYDAIVDDIKAHCETKGNKVWLDKSRSNYGLSSLIPDHAAVDAQTAVTAMKACKNEAELEGMRQAHVVDGVAMAKFITWVQNEIVNEGRKVSEVEIDEKLTGFRAEQPGFVEVSFPTIAGVGSNGAIIHYRAAEGSDLLKYLDAKTPILIDSGGQYLYGTTDVTRTWYFGEDPDQEFVDLYTRVLKGNIGLDEMIFPENTPGFVLDVYARRWLWDCEKDYGHGTGHGVGAALNVHEGPQSISPRFANKEGLKNGMVVSNEPGYYEDGNFGIRIENLLEIEYINPEDKKEANKSDEDEDNDDKKSDKKKKFLKFKKLTMIPIQKNLINIDLMTSRELDWLDEYHEEVFAKVSPHLDPASPEMAWLKKSCEKIDRQ